MPHTMPQEVDVWLLLPAIRKNVAKALLDHYGCSQKEAARLLGLTEAAISQYLKGKRGGEVTFTKKELAEIKKTAGLIHAKPSTAIEALYHLSLALRGSKAVCTAHRRQDRTLPRNCTLCKNA
ncbi:helix-turn-helix domain-containing protein [Candidatus Woesearchaeota archaeon]|nr:MAG: helix-turn-helix domain-containing protein [Candidatus Woesearchaeota archaeon]